MSVYSICSLLVEANYLPKSFQSFLINDSGSVSNIDLVINRVGAIRKTVDQVIIAKLPNVTIWKGLLPDHSHCWIFKSINGIGSMMVDLEYSVVDYTINDHLCFMKEEDAVETIRNLFQIVIECKLIQAGFTIFHAACIELNGVAFAFTGPSGIGKSTRANKWCELLSAKCISGDRPVICAETSIAYGAPWDGKEEVYRNVSYPLVGIYNIHRSNSTHIKKMKEEDRFKLLCEQSFFPIWDSFLVEKTILSLKRLMANIPIYELWSDITDESIHKSYEIMKYVPCQQV